MDHFLGTQRYEDLYYVAPPQWLALFSIGHDEALADLLWLRALVYFGDEIRHRGEVRHIFNYGEAIVALNPDFRRVYHWTGMGSIYRTGHVDEADIRRAASFLERGVQRFPDDGAMHWDYGAMLLYELAPHLTDRDEKSSVKAQGVEQLQIAALLGAGPPWIVLANATELRHLGRAEQALRHLEEVYSTTNDPDIRRQIELQLGRLRSETYAEALRLADAQFRRQHQSSFPYVSPGLYLLLGPRPPIDGAGLLRRGFLSADAFADSEP